MEPPQNRNNRYRQILRLRSYKEISTNPCNIKLIPAGNYMFKVNNKNIRPKVRNMFKVNFERISHLCSSVSIVKFEQVSAGWDAKVNATKHKAQKNKS